MSSGIYEQLAAQIKRETGSFDGLYYPACLRDCASAVSNYRDVSGESAGVNADFNKVLRQNGIFKSPGKVYPSLALIVEDLEKTEEATALAAYSLGCMVQ